MKIDHILGHKTNLKKFKRNKIMKSVFFNHNAVKLETNNRKITDTWNKSSETNRLKTTHSSKGKSQGKFSKFNELNENETTTY